MMRSIWLYVSRSASRSNTSSTRNCLRSPAVSSVFACSLWMLCLTSIALASGRMGCLAVPFYDGVLLLTVAQNFKYGTSVRKYCAATSSVASLLDDARVNDDQEVYQKRNVVPISMLYCAERESPGARTGHHPG